MNTCTLWHQASTQGFLGERQRRPIVGISLAGRSVV